MAVCIVASTQQFSTYSLRGNKRRDKVKLASPKVLSYYSMLRKNPLSRDFDLNLQDSSGLPVLNTSVLQMRGLDLSQGYEDWFATSGGETTKTGFSTGHTVNQASLREAGWAAGGSASGKPLEGALQVFGFRQLLTDLLLAPIMFDAISSGDKVQEDQSEGWVMRAFMPQGSRRLYLQKDRRPQSKHANAAQMKYFGKKFESLCTGRGTVPVHGDEFHAVLALPLGDMSLIMSAEIDCYDPAPANATPSVGTTAAAAKAAAAVAAGTTTATASEAKASAGTALPPVSSWIEIKSGKINKGRGSGGSGRQRLYGWQRIKTVRNVLQNKLGGVAHTVKCDWSGEGIVVGAPRKVSSAAELADAQSKGCFGGLQGGLQGLMGQGAGVLSYVATCCESAAGKVVEVSWQPGTGTFSAAISPNQDIATAMAVKPQDVELLLS